MTVVGREIRGVLESESGVQSGIWPRVPRNPAGTDHGQSKLPSIYLVRARHQTKIARETKSPGQKHRHISHNAHRGGAAGQDWPWPAALELQSSDKDATLRQNDLWKRPLQTWYPGKCIPSTKASVRPKVLSAGLVLLVVFWLLTTLLGGRRRRSWAFLSRIQERHTAECLWRSLQPADATYRVAQERPLPSRGNLAGRHHSLEAFFWLATRTLGCLVSVNPSENVVTFFLQQPPLRSLASIIPGSLSVSLIRGFSVGKM